jgi:opacity protein-like surface antigen
MSCAVRKALAAAVLAFTAPASHAADWMQPPDWEVDVDARLVSSDGQRSFVNGGLGTLRFDDTQSGLRLGRARFALSQALGEIWSLRLDASAWGDHDRNPVDLTEAYLQFRPYPFAGYRFRLKAGAFYAPISLENRAAGWESPYTLSYSAINTWLAQELRTIGVEGQVDWLGTHTGHGFDLALTGGAFGWNDPAGVVIANRGFNLSDRQTTLFGRVGASNSGPLQPLELFREIDGRPGYYAGIEGRYFDRIVIRALHYDNRADPEAFDRAIHMYAWETHFNSVGLRAESANGWTAIVQWLAGQTYVEPHDEDMRWPFRARFALLSRQMGNHRLSIRYDSFAVDSQSEDDDGDGTQHGHAWTAAYVFEPDTHRPDVKCKVTLEWLRVTSDSPYRVIELGTPGVVTETQVQLAVRFALGPLAR